MKVKLLTRMASPEGNFPPGSVVDLDQRVAKALVDSGSAELVEQPAAAEEAPPPAAPPVQTADAPPIAETSEAVPPASEGEPQEVDPETGLPVHRGDSNPDVAPMGEQSPPADAPPAEGTAAQPEPKKEGSDKPRKNK